MALPALGLLTAGCLEAGATDCGDGRVCPAGTVCHAVYGCLLPDQLETCVGIANGESCEIGERDPGRCVDEVCLPEGCGDHLAMGGEDCDGPDLGVAEDCTDLDFYFKEGLACGADCRYDTSSCVGYCNDGQVHPLNEFCDGEAPPGSACTDFGFDVGPLGCTLSCTPGFDSCRHLDWTRVADGEPHSIWVGGDGTVFAVGPGGLILQFGAAGGWSTMDGGTEEDLFGVWGSGPDDVWAVGEGPTLLHYQAGEWSRTALPVSSTGGLNGVWGVDADDVWAVGRGGTILHFDGDDWVEVNSPTGVDLYDVWGTGAGEVYAVGNGEILHREGGVWTQVVTGLPRPVQTVWGSGPDDVWAGGGDGPLCDLRHWNGDDWSVVPCVGDDDAGEDTEIGAIFDIWGSGPDDVFAAGWLGVFMHWDGVKWTRLASPTPVYMRAVAGSSPGNVYASSFTGVWHYTGAGWTATPDPGPAISAIAAQDPHDVWAFSDGAMHHWNGDRWISTAAAQPMADAWSVGGHVFAVGGETIMHRGGGGGWDATTADCTCGAASCQCNLQAVWAASPTDVFAAGDSGNILHYDGDAWTDMPAPVSGPVNSLYGTSGQDVFAGVHVEGASGRVLHYDGEEWTESLRLPNMILIRHMAGAEGHVFTSSFNGVAGSGAVIHHFDGAAWEELMPTRVTPYYGQRVRVFALAPDDVFFAGGDTDDNAMVVHYDGTHWSPVALPGRPVTAVSGTRRRMFWASSDRFAELLRTSPWSCRSSETSCADGVDDDCDGALDALDPDC